MATHDQVIMACDKLRETLEIVKKDDANPDKAGLGFGRDAIVRYKDDWDDQSMADDLGVSKKTIANIRNKWFGGLRIEGGYSTTGSTLKQLTEQLNRLETTLTNLSERIDVISSQQLLQKNMVEKIGMMTQQLHGNLKKVEVSDKFQPKYNQAPLLPRRD
jgi:hypothetical protein